MLKMKMMTFFKNPVVRDIFIILTAVIIVASIIAIPVSKAGSQINVAFRAAPMGISAGTKDMQLPEVAPDQSADKKSKYSNAFCIDEGNHLSYGVYTNEYNVYSSGESSRYFKNYGSAMWLLDNMYIANASNSNVGLDYLAELVTSPDVAKNVSSYGKITTDNIKSLNKTVGGKQDAYGNVLNRNFIEVVEQLVLWNYTNNSVNINPDTLVNGGFSGINISSADQNSAKYLYYSLKYLAGKNSGYKSNGTVSNVVSLDSSKAMVDVNKAQVGPYAIKANGVALNVDNSLKSKISATITKVDGSTQKLDASELVINNDGTFYINIKDCGQISKSKLDISAIYTGATTTGYVIANGKDQNLVAIKKVINTKPLSDEKTVSYSGKYTVKLIKTKADGSTVITENPAKFSVSGAVTKNGELTGKDGVLTIVSEKTISNVAATETYTIVEDEAPNGYTKYDGKITLTVKFKSEGTTYILDKDNVKMDADGKSGMVKLKIPNNDTIEIYVPNNDTKKKQPEFDLALRKFISKIDGKAVEPSREPVINAESKTVLDYTKTAAYHHTKQSITVKEGSLIEYTIRVYNEGEVDGYAKEITDYLPAGLSFVKIADESAKLYTTDAKSDSKKIVIKYNGKDAIKANSIGRILNKETANVYQEVKLICKVNDGVSGYLTNRAEITNYGYTDKSGNWHEAKAINDADRDSVQNTIGNSLGLDKWYENAKSYKFTNGGTTKEIKDYYPGVQDDDDFETVEVIPEGQFKVILKKVDSSNKNQGLEGAYFTCAVGTAIFKVGPTDKNGYVNLIDSQNITSKGQKITYTIRESDAPEGYDKYEKDIVLNIATMESKGKYIVDKENTKLGNEDSKVSLNIDSNIITITIQNDKSENKFDLALRKFITNIDGKEITTRIPKVTLTDDFKSGKVTTAKYEHSKEPLNVYTDSVVTYTIRVYNEYKEDGYASKIMDDIPDGLVFLPEHNTNKENGWVMYAEADKKTENSITYNKKIYVPTTDASKADLIVTNKLNNQLIKGYNAETMKTLDYKDVKVAFKVVEPNSSDRIITNYAQITEHKDKDGKTTVIDRDSTPNEWINGEDDQDIEKIKLMEKDFDLALRKFITNVNGKEITTRIPKVTLTDDFKSGKVTTATYEHSKDPIDVVNGNIIVYTIRVYNEGEVDGYATKVMDDIPDGLQYLPEHEINTEYAWKMYVESDKKTENSITYNKKIYVPTTDASKADLIVTDKIKDQLIKAYDAKTMETLDYKDVKVAFKVVEPNTSDRIIINYAQITEHKDKNGKTTVDDRDSTPNEWIDGEDDQDIEKIRLRYFDLALRKWVTEAIITENGQTQVVKTGHKAEDDPEGVVKVDLKKSKLNDVTVKFRYSIRVTNQGEIAGYAKEVSDYIPEGLKFNPEDNSGWTLVDEHHAVTDALANTLLNPGESAEVTIVLTWINSSKNMGLKVNTAEISKDYNDYGAHDIDSTPGNKVSGEDDIDDAPVMLTVKTGSSIVGYVGLAVAFFAIIGTGVHTIRRRIV